MPFADPEDRRAWKRDYFRSSKRQKKLRAEACRRWRERWSQARIERTFAPARWTCHYCGYVTPVDERRVGVHRLTVDHRLPLCRGGTDAPENLLTACVSCNSRKGRRTYDEYVYGVLNWPRDAMLALVFEEWDAVLTEER